LKRQSTEWEKIFANCISIRGLIFKYGKNSNNLTTTKPPPNNPTKKGQKIRIDISVKKKH